MKHTLDKTLGNEINRILYPEKWLDKEGRFNKKIVEDWFKISKKNNWLLELRKQDAKMLSDNATIATRISFFKSIKKLIAFIDKPLKKITESDIIKYLGENNNIALQSDITRRVWIVIFFNRLYKVTKKGEKAKIVEGIKIPMYNAVEEKPIEEKQVLTAEEIKKMISCSNHPRNKALIAVLYESGCRANELLQLKIKDVEVNERDIVLRVQTGKRKDNRIKLRNVLLVDSYFYLTQWLRQHPNKDDPEAWLFVSFSGYTMGEQLTYQGLYRVVRRAGEAAKIKKEFNPHWLRHSQIKLLEGDLSDSELRERFGWNKGSNMVARYSHLSSEDVVRKQREQKGLIEPDKKKSNKPVWKECPRCMQSNNLNVTKYCSRCGSPLDVKTLMDREYKIEKSDEGHEKMFKKTGGGYNKEILKDVIRDMIKKGEIKF